MAGEISKKTGFAEGWVKPLGPGTGVPTGLGEAYRSVWVFGPPERGTFTRLLGIDCFLRELSIP